MTQSERRLFLINKLLREQPQYRDVPVPKSETEQKRLLRTLMNIRRPMPIGDDFLAVQDEYLQAEIMDRGTTDLSDLSLRRNCQCGELRNAGLFLPLSRLY